ncbi:MAG: helix-turn-helix domain-containing protein [Gammaproteobacteria bacterium]|nr:helix-turn-helix domain-containing protein [Gammaproteobacteria bacterium]
MDIKIVFGKVLKELRAEKGVSQERLALEAELDRSYVSALERGIYQPSITKLFDIARVLGVRPGEIIDRVEHEMKES